MTVNPDFLTRFLGSAALAVVMAGLAPSVLAQDVRIVQPGAPGDAAKELTAEEAGPDGLGRRKPDLNSVGPARNGPTKA